MGSTGIAVFAYNRPTHLEKVLSGLKQNEVDHLYIFADGPKNDEDRQRVRATRQVIDGIDWCEKTVFKSEQNQGLAISITTGIERVFQDHDRIIVLEDDCVPGSNFIRYMASCLEEYEQEERVMHVNGFAPPIEISEDYPYDIYFTYRTTSWGWGTWQSAWDHFEQNPMSLEEFRSSKQELKQSIAKAGQDLVPMIRNQLLGKIDSWAVWWSYAVVSANGVTVTPVESRIKNIGHDESGTHSPQTDKYLIEIGIEGQYSCPRFPPEVTVDKELNKQFVDKISGGRRGQIRRMFSRARSVLGIDH